MDPKHARVDKGSRSKGMTSWLKQKTAQQGKINDRTAEGVNPSTTGQLLRNVNTWSYVRMYLSFLYRCSELVLRNIEEYGYPFQCKVGNLLISKLFLIARTYIGMSIHIPQQLSGR